MKKVFVEYNDGSKVTYTMRNEIDHMKYVNRHIHDKNLSLVILQQYPKKNNEPVILKGANNE